MGKQYNPYDNVIATIERAAGILGLERSEYEPLKYPERELKVYLPVEMDDGSIQYMWIVQKQKQKLQNLWFSR